jgi:hypothetical protein
MTSSAIIYASLERQRRWEKGAKGFNVKRWRREREYVPLPTLLPPFSIKSPALIKASPAYPPAVRVPASTKPSTLFQMMLETKFMVSGILLARWVVGPVEIEWSLICVKLES